MLVSSGIVLGFRGREEKDPKNSPAPEAPYAQEKRPQASGLREVLPIMPARQTTIRFASSAGKSSCESHISNPSLIESEGMPVDSTDLDKATYSSQR